MKLFWDKTYEYQRILEILRDYWTSEEDEAAVIVDMRFKKRDGQYQEKKVKWKHPEVEKEEWDEIESMDMSEEEKTAMHFPTIGGADLLKMTSEDFRKFDDEFLGL